MVDNDGYLLFSMVPKKVAVIFEFFSNSYYIIIENQ